MTLTLYYHPLSSYCQKTLIALYEADAPFEGEIIDFSDAASAATLSALWPMRKFPVLRDETRGLTLPESSIIIEHVAAVFPKAAGLIPNDPAAALDARLWDRFFDNYVMTPMQKIVGDRLRPKDKRDPFGVEEARAGLEKAYGVIETRMTGRDWAAGESFTMADCAAPPALFYANRIAPFEQDYPSMARYFSRLKARPSYVRALEEAEPYLHLFPEEG